ncbi:FaeA/PapI family transcriptional regulator [Escherichia coli]|uniref:FaeA/PapI family transcriptional regulator n=1 Tax=Escherichia coli TaxID=562 RepID=UPI0010DCFD60|nr:FaeA/PapI family transcriptional regulator [Escherichia coli]GDM21675.1 pap operon regulatory protein PapI [Escherichia coli]
MNSSTELKDRILSYAGKINSPCRTAEIASHFGLSAYQARHYLLSLEQEGKIKRSPVRRGASTTWQLSDIAG